MTAELLGTTWKMIMVAFTHGKTEKDRKDTNLNDGIPEDRFRHRLKDTDNVLWAAVSSNVVHETLVKLFIRGGIRSDDF